MKNPPVYDPATDGNVYEWILVAAWTRRALRSVAAPKPARREPDAQQAAFDAAIEAEERQRFQTLRDRARLEATSQSAKPKTR